MVDQIRKLLLNVGDSDIRKVDDPLTDKALSLFGVVGDCNDAAVVDTILPLAMADDLSHFRRLFDRRTTATAKTSVYRHSYTSCGDCGSCASLLRTGLYERVLGTQGWWTIAQLFSVNDPVAAPILAAMREAARSADSTFALGAVILACAYRRLLLQDSKTRSL